MVGQIQRGFVSARLALGLAVVVGASMALWVALKRPAPSVAEQPCDLNEGPCRASLEGGASVEVTVQPRPIPLLKPLRIEARFAGGRASDVVLTATSETMDMGVTKVPLLLAGEAFVGEASLPVCASDTLRWTARLDFVLDGAPRTATLRFSTHRLVEPTKESAGVEVMSGPPVDFTLHSASGPVHLSDFRGKVVLLYFGYTFCPDICPTSLAATSRALASLAPEDLARVQTLFVSVDPARDTPEHLAEYAGFFHPSILGVTGTDEEVAVAARPYGVVYARHAVEGASGYVVDHSAFTYLVAPDGHLAARLPHAARAPLVVAELAKWLPRAAAVPSK
jgi:protein SCO1